MKTTIKKTGTLVVGATLVIAMSAAAIPQVRQTERLVKRAEDTVAEIGSAKAQLQSTLDLYNTLMGGRASDAKKLYSDLGKAVDATLKKRDDVRKRGEDMEKEAYKFFEEWTASLEAITSEELRQRSQERLNDTRVNFSGILAEGRQAGADFDVFMGGLRDQIVYLGYDLNPGGIASLAEDAERLNAAADVLFVAIDEVIATITEYAESMRVQ